LTASGFRDCDRYYQRSCTEGRATSYCFPAASSQKHGKFFFHQSCLAIDSFKQEPWDQKGFEVLLLAWMITCDQPFEEVEHPEFKALLNYVHNRGTQLNIPSSTTVHRRVMKLGKDTWEDLKKMISVCLLHI